MVFGQEPAHKLNLVIVEGEGMVNNIRQRDGARSDRAGGGRKSQAPVAGAAVLFLLPEHGAGGTFTTGGHTLSVVTDAQGRAVARGIMPNSVKGNFRDPGAGVVPITV